MHVLNIDNASSLMVANVYYQLLQDNKLFCTPTLLDDNRKHYQVDHEEVQYIILNRFREMRELSYFEKRFVLIKKLQEIFGFEKPIRHSVDFPLRDGDYYRFDGEHWVINTKRGFSYNFTMKSNGIEHMTVDGVPVQNTRWSRNVPFHNREQRRRKQESYSITLH